MRAPPSRYFPGRAPTVGGFQSDDSDADADRASTGERDVAIKPHASALQPAGRRRIAARVVKSGTDSGQPVPTVRGTSSSFVPIGGAALQSGVELPASASESGSESPSDSDGNDGPVGAAFDACDSASGDANDDSQQAPRPILRPIFVRRDAKDRAEKRREDALQNEEERRLDERRQEAKRLLAQVLRDEQRRRETSREHDVLPDDTDRPEDRDADYALWKVREILRIRRDREEMRAWQNRTSLPSSVTVGDVDT